MKIQFISISLLLVSLISIDDCGCSSSVTDYVVENILVPMGDCFENNWRHQAKTKLAKMWRKEGNRFKYLSDINGYKKDEDFMSRMVKENGLYLELASDDIRANRTVVLNAVKNNGYALEFASTELKADIEVVMEAIKNCAGALEYASENLKGDEEVVLEAVKKEGHAFRSSQQIKTTTADGEKYVFVLCDNEEIIKTAVKTNGWMLELASDTLRDDYDTVMTAVKQCGFALSFASDHLKDEESIVLAAVNQNPNSLKHASDKMKANKKVHQQILGEGKNILKKIQTFAGISSLILSAIEIDFNNMSFVSASLRGHKKFMLNAAKIDLDTLCYITDKLVKDKDFADKVVEMLMEKSATEDLGSETDDCMGEKPVSTDCSSRIEPTEFYKECVKKCVNKCGLLLQHFPQFRNDKEVVEAAIDQNGHAFAYASDELKRDKDFVSEMVEIDKSAILYVPLRMRFDLPLG